MRRIILTLLVTAALAGAGWTLYQWNRPVPRAADPWQAVPAQSAVVLHIPEAWGTWDRFTHTSQLWTALEEVPGVRAAARLLGGAAERMEHDAALRDALSGTPVIVALQRAGGDAVACVVAGVLPPGQSAPLRTIVELLGADAAAAQALAGGGVVQVRPDTALPMLSFTVQRGLWLLANTPDAMDGALLQLNGGTAITDDSLFTAAHRTLGAGSDAHLMLHTQRAHRLLHTWWTPDAVERPHVPDAWVALDLRTRPDALLMSGLLFPAGPDTLLEAIARQGSGTHTAARALPDAVTVMQVQHIADAVQWLADHGRADAPHADALFHWVHGPIGTATAPADDAGPARHWAFFTAADPEEAAEALHALCADGCDTLTYRGHRMARLPRPHLHDPVAGHRFADLERPWWTVLGEVVLFSDAPTALVRSIDVWNDGRSLAEHGRTTAWNERIGTSAGRMLWCDVGRSTGLLAEGMRAPYADAMRSGTPWGAFGGATVRVEPGPRGHLQVVAGLQYAPVQRKAPTVLWATPLESPVAGGPHVVRNHVTGTREVFVQDDAHRVHLIGGTGKVLWSRQLEGPIMGGVHQVDRFRNGKLQLLFNTEKRLHLIDRNGKDVGGFPADLKPAATAPVAVFDYDGTRDYRLVVPVDDGRLLNIGIDGLAVKGWEAARMPTPATNPVYHVRILNKDFIVAVDGGGRVSLLDRRGVVREPCELVLGPGAVVQQIVPGGSIGATRIVWSLPDGSLKEAPLQGAETVLHGPAAGTCWWADLDGDGRAETVRIAGDSLVVQRDGRPVWSRVISGLRPEFRPYAFARGAWAVAAVRADGRVGLVDDRGHDMQGLPVAGVRAPAIADLNGDGELELIVATAEGIVAAHRIPSVAGEQR
jgi:hypothetical protein